VEYVIAYLIVGLFVFIYSVNRLEKYLEFGVVDFKLIGIFVVALPWILLLLVIRLGIKTVGYLVK
jgi:hypothetical protein